MLVQGGLAVLLRLWDTRLCFVACHLAAHQNKLEDRNENVRMILRCAAVPKLAVSTVRSGLRS